MTSFKLRRVFRIADDVQAPLQLFMLVIEVLMKFLMVFKFFFLHAVDCLGIKLFEHRLLFLDV
jgi:hypothetical protein